MRGLRHRKIAILALLAYTSAMVGAVCFHHHGHEHPHGSPCAIQSSASIDEIQHHCCAHHTDHPAPEQKDHSPESPQPHPHHDDCSVCQFLVTKTIFAAGISTGEQIEVVSLAEPASVPLPASPALPLPPSRGPPWML